jgi:hypothetical protein
MEKFHFKEVKSTLNLDVPRAKTEALEGKPKSRTKKNVVVLDVEVTPEKRIPDEK